MAKENLEFCPAGTGKRIKQCCPELAEKLATISRMYQGRQYRAVLQQLDLLLERHPNKPCLIFLKASVLRVLRRENELNQLLEDTPEKFPEASRLWFDGAVHDIEQGRFEKGLRRLLHLINRDGQLCGEISDAETYWISQICMLFGCDQAALFFARSQPSSDVRNPWITREVPFLHRDLVRKAQKPSLLVNDPAADPFCGVEGQSYDEILANLDGRLQNNEQTDGLLYPAAVLAALAGQNEQASTLLGQLAAKRESPTEKAILMATACSLRPIAFDDPQQVLVQKFKVTQPKLIEEKLRSRHLCGRAPMRPRLAQVWMDMAVRPEAVAASFLLMADPSQGTLSTAEALAEEPKQPLAFLHVCTADRQIEYIVAEMIPADKHAEFLQVINEVFGDTIAPDGEPAETKVSATELDFLRLDPPMARVPYGTLDRQHRRKRIEKYVLEIWPDRPLGLLQGQTPRQAAQKAELKPLVEAAIFLLEDLLRRTHSAFDFDVNKLRRALGLQPISLIALSENNWAGLERVHMLLWQYVDLTNIPTDELLQIFELTGRMGAGYLSLRILRECRRRFDTLEYNQKATILRALAGLSPESSEQFAAVEQGRRIAKDHDQDHASWDLDEAFLAASSNQLQRALMMQLHVMREHKDSPGVADRLRDLDTVLRAAQMVNQMQAAAEQESAPLVGEPEAGGGQQQEGKKLWIPGT